LPQQFGNFHQQFPLSAISNSNCPEQFPTSNFQLVISSLQFPFAIAIQNFKIFNLFEKIKKIRNFHAISLAHQPFLGFGTIEDSWVNFFTAQKIS